MSIPVKKKTQNKNAFTHNSKCDPPATASCGFVEIGMYIAGKGTCKTCYLDSASEYRIKRKYNVCDKTHV